MSASKAKTVQQRLYGAVVPLAKPVTLDRAKLHEQLRAVAEAAGAHIWDHGDASPTKRGLLSSLRGGSTGFRIEMSGIDLLIRPESRPLCNAKAMHSFINPTLWKSRTSGITGHKGYIMISEEERTASETSRDAMFDRATAVTLAAAALADLPGAEGAIWLPARNALPISVFGSEMERFLDGQAPLMFWIRAQTIPAPVQAERQFGELSGGALEPGVATMGLTAFMGSEIVAPPSHCDRDVVLDYVFALASAVIDENANLKDGALLGQGANQMRLVMRKPGEHSERPYWELEAVNKPVAKPRPVRQEAAEPLTAQPQTPVPPHVPGQMPPYQMPPAAMPQGVPSAPPLGVPQPTRLDAGFGGGVGRLPSTDKALVDPDEVLKAAMSSADPLDALPAALRPPRPHPGMSAGGPGVAPLTHDAPGSLSPADAEAALRAAMENPHGVAKKAPPATPMVHPSMPQPSMPAPSMPTPSMPVSSGPTAPGQAIPDPSSPSPGASDGSQADDPAGDGSVAGDSLADIDPAAALRRAMLGPSTPDGEADDLPAPRWQGRQQRSGKPTTDEHPVTPAEPAAPQKQLSQEDLDALPAALRPVDPNLKPPPMDGGLAGAGAEDRDALPAALRPSGPAASPPDTKTPDTKGDDAPAKEKPEVEAIVTDEDLRAKDARAKAKAKARDAQAKRRPPKRLPSPEDDHGSLGTDIPRPSAEERFDETEEAPKDEDKSDASFFDKHLRLVGRR